VYEVRDYYDEATRTSAVMRARAFPVSIIARMLLMDRITLRRALSPGVSVPGERAIRQPAQRNITITEARM
jgi:hypothetical protein